MCRCAAAEAAVAIYNRPILCMYMRAHTNILNSEQLKNTRGEMNVKLIGTISTTVNEQLNLNSKIRR